MKTFEDCKNEVAELAGYKTWQDMEIFVDEVELSIPDSMWQSAANMFARSYSEDKIKTVASNFCEFTPYEGRYIKQIVLKELDASDHSNIVIP